MARHPKSPPEMTTPEALPSTAGSLPWLLEANNGFPSKRWRNMGRFKTEDEAISEKEAWERGDKYMGYDYWKYRITENSQANPSEE